MRATKNATLSSVDFGAWLCAVACGLLSDYFQMTTMSSMVSGAVRQSMARV